MRILLTVPATQRDFGGPQGKAIALSSSLRALGLEVKVMGAGSVPDGTEIEGLGSMGRFHATPIPRSYRPLRREIERCEVLHVLGFRDPVGSLAMMNASRYDIPSILEPCGMHRRRLRSERLKKLFDWSLGDRLVSQSSRVIATSSLERSELLTDGIKEWMISVRPNGIDLGSSIRREGLATHREQIGFSPKVPLVLSLGRIARKKSLDHLLLALTRAPGPNALIIGPDSRDGTLQRLEEMRARLGLKERVRIDVGGVWGETKALAFASADLFCLPSETENFGTAAAEAAGMGLPVVISDRCGVAEYLPRNSTRVVRFGDIPGLAGALTEMSDPRAKTLAEANVDLIQQVLNWHAIAREQLRIYEDVLEST